MVKYKDLVVGQTYIMPEIVYPPMHSFSPYNMVLPGEEFVLMQKPRSAELEPEEFEIALATGEEDQWADAVVLLVLYPNRPDLHTAIQDEYSPDGYIAVDMARFETLDALRTNTDTTNFKVSVTNPTLATTSSQAPGAGDGSGSGNNPSLSSKKKKGSRSLNQTQTSSAAAPGGRRRRTTKKSSKKSRKTRRR
jgi:hypothetical protein